MPQEITFIQRWDARHSIETVSAAIENQKLPAEISRENLLISLPYSYLLEERFIKSPYTFGLNDAFSLDPGTFTETVADKLILETKAKFVLLGNTLNRKTLQESNLSIQRKIKLILQLGLRPFLCFGEGVSDFEANMTEDIIKTQFQECIGDSPPEQIKNITFLYETPTSILYQSDVKSEEFNKSYELCRKVLQELYGDLGTQISLFCALPAAGKLDFSLLPQLSFNGFLIKNEILF